MTNNKIKMKKVYGIKTDNKMLNGIYFFRKLKSVGEKIPTGDKQFTLTVVENSENLWLTILSEDKNEIKNLIEVLKEKVNIGKHFFKNLPTFEIEEFDVEEDFNIIKCASNEIQYLQGIENEELTA